MSLSGGRLEYEFRAAIIDGGHGNPTTVTIPCIPGDVIAWGQKDLRKPASNESHLARMADDGSLVEISRADAIRHLKAK